MKIVNVYIEHPVMQLNTTFTYCYSDDREIARGYRVKVDFNGRDIIGFVDSVEEIENINEYEQKLGYTIKQITEVVDNEALLNDELYSLGLWMSRQTVCPIISCFTAMLPPSLKPTSSFKSVAKEKWAKVNDDNVLIEYKLPKADMSLAEIKKYISEYRLKKLRINNQITVYDKEKQATVEEMKINDTPYPLSEQQKQAIETINNTDKQVCLLYGLTGSGKTEVYMQLTRQTVEDGKQVLILVPEISLTPMMVSRFKERFNNNIAVYHSGLNAQQKYEQYKLIKEGKVKIVVGTRSAAFMPFNNLGLIVLDEEHDNSYKQDSMPKYNTRDVVIKRSEYHHCKVILGSATPTLESYARAIKDVYQLVSLTKRVANNLPTAHLVDMSVESRKGNFIISAPLANAIKNRIQNNQQVILLLNRRGYTPMMKCSNCGYVITCPHCDVAMSFHKDENILVCHSCGETTRVVETCPKCGGNVFRNYGVGTQRLTEEVTKLCPQAKVIRMDADVTKVKDAHQNILNAFEKHEYDILVGTQMISKGLDFPDVTLVGIFNADGPLARSDYRSVETTFDLIVQASGRSGRSKHPGEVFIQAYDVDHYGIQLAARQDYYDFFRQEMNYRHAAKYPPYSYLISIGFNSTNEQLAKESALDAMEYFREDESMKVLGPSHLLKRRDETRYRIILKSTNRQEMIDKLWLWYDKQQINKKKISVVVDVDPYVLD